MYALTNGHASNSFLVISSIYNSPHRPIEAFQHSAWSVFGSALWYIFLNVRFDFREKTEKNY